MGSRLEDVGRRWEYYVSYRMSGKKGEGFQMSSCKENLSLI